MSGGHINITCKYIQTQEDLTFKDETKFKGLIENAKHGMIEFIVEDTGIGIK